jgi:hypothetical protein
MRERVRKGSVPALAAMVTAASLLIGARPCFAEEIVCQGRLGRITVDNVLVPQGKRCVLNGTRVQGNVVVETGATLQALTVRVIGSVQAEGAASVQILRRSSIGGSVQLVQGGGAVVDFARITGDILFDSNQSPLAATRNTVGGNVQAFQNTGGVEISDNLIDGNLQCKANNPPPTGGGNIVQGEKQDQCAKL